MACSNEGSNARSDSANPSGSAGSNAALTGAGATFPYPIYSKWFSDYATETGVKINYQSIGSGGGIRQVQEQTVDFGATDAPMTNEEIAKAKGGAVLHFPTVLGADVITYNLPGLTSRLRLTGLVLGDIFLGRVRKWNAPAIAALNPGVNLPNTDILVVHRSDGSGTTYIFTSYLTAVSPAWKAGPGAGKEVAWPVGLGGKGNEGVAGQVKQTPGSIGYVELAYAKQNGLAYALMQNAAGQFVEPTLESITAAAGAIADTLTDNSDYRVSIINPNGATAYPIASMTWLLIYQNQTDAAKGRALVDFMRWAYEKGQPAAAALDYAPLPDKMRAQLVTRLSSIKLPPGA
ncbi:MAG: phosphate ABC transporter substrate-binding protein PstS [Gemmatimonadota bacterium]|nr:phosphate ABC transporter substrate-binding protein PstS [Gemmatimonadota bacterium]